MAPAKVGTVLGNPKNSIHKGGPLQDDDDQFFQNLQDDDKRDQVAVPNLLSICCANMLLEVLPGHVTSDDLTSMSTCIGGNKFSSRL